MREEKRLLNWIEEEEREREEWRKEDKKNEK